MAGEGSRRSVLIIANDEALRKLLRAVLKSHGYGVELVSSADQAVERIETATFGAVIIDADRSGENVEEFLSSRDGDGTPVIALVTGPLSVEDARLRATMLKPFEIQRLAAIVDTTCHGTA